MALSTKTGCRVHRIRSREPTDEKVRQGGQVLDAAVLIANGVDAEGHRDVLGCSVSADKRYLTFTD